MAKEIKLDEPLLTTDELAELLRVSARYVRLRCEKDEWPHLEQPWRNSVRYLFTAEHRALILSSMDPAPAIPIRRPRRTTPAPAPRKRARS